MFNPLTQSPMARVIFHTKKVVVLESENLFTVMTHDTEWLASFPKSNVLALGAAISEARFQSTYGAKRTEFWSGVECLSYDQYLSLEDDCCDVNHLMNQPYPMVNREN